MNGDSNETVKARLLAELTRHIGRPRAIGMAELYEKAVGRPCGNRINGTRRLRKLITELREEGVAICSTAETDGGGYYLASPGGSEFERYCAGLRAAGLRKLALEAKIRRRTLPGILSEIQLELRP
ncbi:hypothetical protein G3N56_03515 [Desulfovibrio sulfodismutans]|uniref:Uncharacterized protein n=1 Tax=Desulfolutivibrio sulfodismutans TaxID=63561 RepID=A0A7K3NI11_9BACT|nr:hypothetical protein [Desulfolutivibrio sulfodismutans]NDY55810.1 hypothetical protein [Desulfolutivibrio sulfodismutans]QLA14214.1 hypothetical protein GD606_19055 [Desulfolutivibrio sulfodismutans DSM 3696]